MMTLEEQKILTDQVAELIQQQKANEDYLYYNHFINECQKYGLSEVDFNKQILAEAFNRYTGPIIVKSGPNSEVFGKRCYTLEQLGEQFFSYPAKCEIYMADDTLFRKDVSRIENTDKTLDLLQVFNSEQSLSKRYLRVVYHLNATLPYRIGSELSETVNVLLQKGFQNYNFYEQIVNSFSSGHLQIWLEETDPNNSLKLNGGSEYNDFLSFIYTINKTYPFYVKEKHFFSPIEVVVQAQKSINFRETIYQYIKNGRLPTWFDSIGNQQWNSKYQAVVEQISDLTYYDSDDKKQVGIQCLLQIIDPSVLAPQIVSDDNEIKLLTIEASKQQQHTVTFRLQNIGVIKGLVSLENEIEGVSINKGIITFNSFTNTTSEQFIIDIDPVKLVKDKLYQNQINISTINNSLSIPLEIKIVFPKKAYVGYVLKFSAYGALYFGMLRLILGLFVGDMNWLKRYSYYTHWDYDLPNNYFLYVIALFILIIALSLSYLYRKGRKTLSKSTAD